MSNELQCIAELTSMKILYVEDDEIIADGFIQMMRRMAPRIHYSKNGKEGMESYKTFAPDIVITDIKMPVMSGLEMAKLIRLENSDIPIIIVSAYNENEFLKEAFEIGITHYLNKPLNRLVLMRTLNESAKSVIYKKRQKEIIENYEDTISSFVDLIERRDRYTAGHTARVAHYCFIIAQAMNFSKEDCKRVEKAAMVHDIGKIEIPDSILLNPERLNALEYEIVKEHLNSGYLILSKSKQFTDIAEIMRHHHERYNGSGYPQGLKGNEIPMLSHIMMVSDVFDAMTTNRIYKPKKSIKEALLEIESLSGIAFHPDVVKVALEVLKDIKIENSETQMPKTLLEEKKFSYFFSDLLTGLHNEPYLNYLLNNCSTDEKELFGIEYITIIDLHKISNYNKINGWEKGNQLIQKIATFLLSTFKEELLFRIRGDVFYILSKERVYLLEGQLNELIGAEDISFDIIEYHFNEYLYERSGLE